MPPTTAPIRFAGSALGEYRHVCAFFDTPDQEYRALLPFVRDGLAHGDRVVHLIPRDRGDHRDRLAPAGIDVDAAQGTGQLEVLSSEQTYLRDGRFDQDAMLEALRGLLDAGHARGFSLTRVVAHAEHVLEDCEGRRDFLEYESRLNHMLPRYPDPVICTYDLTQINAATALDVLRTHPMAIIGDVLQANPYFVPPELLLEELRADRAREARDGASRARA